MIVKAKRSFTGGSSRKQVAAAVEPRRRRHPPELAALHLDVEVARRRQLGSRLVGPMQAVGSPFLRRFEGAQELLARQVRADLRGQLLEEPVARPGVETE